MKNYTKTNKWKNKVRCLSNDDLLELYKTTIADSMISIEFDALVFMREEILNRMKKPML